MADWASIAATYAAVNREEEPRRRRSALGWRLGAAALGALAVGCGGLEELAPKGGGPEDEEFDPNDPADDDGTTSGTSSGSDHTRSGARTASGALLQLADDDVTATATATGTAENTATATASATDATSGEV